MGDSIHVEEIPTEGNGLVEHNDDGTVTIMAPQGDRKDKQAKIHAFKLHEGVLPLHTARHAEFLHNEVPGITIPDDVRAATQQARGGLSARGLATGPGAVVTREHPSAAVQVVTACVHQAAAAARVELPAAAIWAGPVQALANDAGGAHDAAVEQQHQRRGQAGSQPCQEMP